MDSSNSGNHTALISLERQSLDRHYNSQPLYYEGGQGSEWAERSIQDYWKVLYKRRWTLAAVVVIVVAVTAIASFRMTPLYESVGRISINKENSEPLGFKDMPSNGSADWDLDVELDTQIRILKSDAIAGQVIRGLQLDKNPKFAGKLTSTESHGAIKTIVPASNAMQESLLRTFRDGLRVERVPHTRLIAIYYLSPDPALSAQVINTLASTYIEQNFKTKFESIVQTSDWLQKQIADLQLKIETSQEKLVRYQRENGILGIDEKQNIVTEKLDELNKELTAAEADRIQKESEYRMSSLGTTYFGANANQGKETLMEKLRAQEADLKTQYAQATTQFGPAYPKVLELGNQLRQVQDNIASETKSMGKQSQHTYLAAVDREKMLRAAFENQKREANRLNESSIQYNLLKRDVESNRQLYEDLLHRLKEAGVSASLRSSNISVIDSARVPTVPAKPNIPRNIGLALLVGLVGGVGLVFVLEGLDNTVRTPEEVQRITALPALGIVPQALTSVLKNGHLALPVEDRTEQAKKVQLVTYARPKSAIAESYRSLRTSILLSSPGGPPKVILVTSGTPREGKTVTSINCAIVLAQRGERVLLVDADVRRPDMHTSFGIDNRVGLTSLLTTRGNSQDAIVSCPFVPNLFLLPAGPTPPHPAELLSSALMKKYLSEWREKFDHIVIDTPPILSVTDAVVLSPLADAVIIVVRSGATSKHALARTRSVLQSVNAKIMGVIVNGVDLRSPDYSYGYYGYYHHPDSASYYEEQATGA